ncbi:MAG: diacylglycerol kinase family protein [Pseudomonadota bacterium]
MTLRFGMVSNPLSHAVSQRGAVLKQAAAREREQVIFRCLDRFDDLHDILDEFAAADVQAVFVEGGDGTAMAVLTEILTGRAGLRLDIPIALLPGGMTNLAAKVMGVHKAGRGGIKAVMDDIRAGRLETRVHDLPLLEVSLAKNAQPLFGFFLSTGAVPHGIRYCRRALHTRGAQGSFAVGLTLARLIFGPRGQDGNEVMRPTDLTLESDAFHAAGAHLFTLATTLPRLNLGLDPFWGEASAPLRLTHASWPANGLLTAFGGILAGAKNGYMRKRGMESFNVHEALLKYSGDLVLDGEFLAAPPSGKIKVSTTSPVRFIR